MIVSDICTQKVVTIRKEDTITDAALRMRESHVGNLVVVEDRDGEQFPTGILTDRDIVVGVIARDIDHLKALRVEDVMTTDVVVAHEDETIENVLKRMRSCGVRRMPVVNGKGSLSGVLAVDDILSQVWRHLTDVVTLVACQQERERKLRD